MVDNTRKEEYRKVFLRSCYLGSRLGCTKGKHLEAIKTNKINYNKSLFTPFRMRVQSIVTFFSAMADKSDTAMDSALVHGNPGYYKDFTL